METKSMAGATRPGVTWGSRSGWTLDEWFLGWFWLVSLVTDPNCMTEDFQVEKVWESATKTS